MRISVAPGGGTTGRVRGMLPALLEESGPTSRTRRGRHRLGAASLAISLALGVAACGGGERQDADEPEGEFPVEIAAAEFPAKQRLAETSELTLSVRNAGDETIPDLAITVFTAEDDPEELADADAADETSETGETGETGEETATDEQGEEIPEEELGSAVEQALQEELQAEGEAGEDPDASTATDTEATADDGLSQADGPFSVRSDQPGLAIPSRPVWILEQGYPQIAGTESAEPPLGELSAGSGAGAAQTNTFSFGSLDPGDTRDVVFQVTPVQSGTYTVHYRIAAGLQGKAVAVNADGSVPEGEFVVRITDVPPQTRVDDSGKVVPIEKSDLIGQAGSEEQRSELGDDSP